MIRPVKKKKPTPRNIGGRRTKIQTPDFNAEIPIPVRQAEATTHTTVGAGELKGVVNETVWRIINEISPDFEAATDARLNSDEIGYLIVLSMVLGNPEESPRRGLKIRNHEYADGDTPFCRTHR
jgi:hypothetical protein